MEPFDLIVIGSGPGGYVAAIYAAKKGMKVACIEKGGLGGTCLNVGCIPSKALLHSTEYYDRIATQGKKHGIHFKELTVNLDEMMKRKLEVVSHLTAGVSFLFKKHKIAVFQGEATLTSANSVAIKGETLQAKNLLLATGSEPISLPFLPFDEKVVLSSTGALSLPKLPKKMIMIGAGIIGLELGSVYRRLGVEVDVVELLNRITPTLDEEISKTMLHILKKQGINFHLERKVTKANVQKEGLEIFVENQSEPFRADVVLVAIGRRPFTKGLGIEKVGIELDKLGRIVVDSCFRTNIPHIFAIGDVIDGPMLAHKASEEGVAVVDYLLGEKREINYVAIPNVMYTWPEVATVGLTEKEAREEGLDIKIGKVPFKGIPRAKASGDEEGLVKIIGEKKSDRLVGLHIIGPMASEMIHEGVLGIEQKMTLKELGEACHAHPTCSEAIKEAALLANNNAVHY